MLELDKIERIELHKVDESDFLYFYKKLFKIDPDDCHEIAEIPPYWEETDKHLPGTWAVAVMSPDADKLVHITANSERCICYDIEKKIITCDFSKNPSLYFATQIIHLLTQILTDEELIKFSMRR